MLPPTSSWRRTGREKRPVRGSTAPSTNALGVRATIRASWQYVGVATDLTGAAVLLAREIAHLPAQRQLRHWFFELARGQSPGQQWLARRLASLRPPAPAVRCAPIPASARAGRGAAWCSVAHAAPRREPCFLAWLLRIRVSSFGTRSELAIFSTTVARPPRRSGRCQPRISRTGLCARRSRASE